MSDRDQPRQGRCPRWMRVLLGVSLALNLLVAGLAAGAALLRSNLQPVERAADDGRPAAAQPLSNER